MDHWLDNWLDNWLDHWDNSGVNHNFLGSSKRFNLGVLVNNLVVESNVLSLNGIQVLDLIVQIGSHVFKVMNLSVTGIDGVGKVDVFTSRSVELHGEIIASGREMSVLVGESGDLQVKVSNHSLVVSVSSLKRSELSSGGVELSGQVSDGDVESVLLISPSSELLL